MNEKTRFFAGFLILLLIITLSLSTLGMSKSNPDSLLSPLQPISGSDTLSSDESARAKGTDTFKPTVRKPAWVDKNDNSIADSFDREIAERLANGTAQQYVNITVMLRSAPTAYDTYAFASVGGHVTTPLWTKATYGFGGRIRYDRILNFAQRDSDVLLVEKEIIGQVSVAYAAKQVGARPYVWNTLGLQGDPQSSIAIIDSGIDASHPDFSPGYGDKDFSKKIVGWNDLITPGTIIPYDDYGHGSHVSGLAAGDGFFSTDASGYATATEGENVGTVSLSGSGYLTGMMVNRTGTITISVAWNNPTGYSYVSSAALVYGDENQQSWTVVRYVPLGSSSKNTWYTMTYNVASISSGGYDMYHVAISYGASYPNGNLYVVVKMSWPYTPPADGFSAWTGIAPQSKLVGVKVANINGGISDTAVISAIDWIIANRQAYHITVASMSLGGTSESSQEDSAVVNLVNNGVTTVVSANNSDPGSGANKIYSPGSVDEAITVAAMNQFDNISSYSNQGGASHSTGLTTKPDITAPGGDTGYTVPLFSADSNTNDASYWTDFQANDSRPMQGTSMATPIVSGAAEVVIQAMGGFSNWQWTRSQALRPKMILLMTATETYPNVRDGGTSSTSPTLDRGGKDVHEGYGRLNLDAAVDAILKEYRVGTTATGTLGMPPTPTNIAVLGQRLAWARKVPLVQGFSYTFTLNVPTGADYDLYLYNVTGTTYGEPAIVAKSTNAVTGETEQITVIAPYTGFYFIVVKRATETTGSGTFTLTSPGLPSDIWPDGKIDGTDLFILGKVFGTNNIFADITGPAGEPDGIVDKYDLEAVAATFGEHYP